MFSGHLIYNRASTRATNLHCQSRSRHSDRDVYPPSNGAIGYKLWSIFWSIFWFSSFVNSNTWHLICNNYLITWISWYCILTYCVCVFSLHWESLDMILGDKPLLFQGGGVCHTRRFQILIHRNWHIHQVDGSYVNGKYHARNSDQVPVEHHIHVRCTHKGFDR
jgi:hypothetical protein